jgi:hypothetical protein
MAELASTYGNPSRFSELVFGTPLHAGQRRYVDGAVADVNFLLPGNSWGKTEFICREVTYDSWFKVDKWGVGPQTFQEWLELKYKSLVASYNYPIAKESFERFLHYYKNREEVRALCAKAPTISDPVRVEFTNGAIVDWGSLDGQGKLVEAARRQRIYVDEAGHIPDLSYTFDNILFPRTMGVGGVIHLLGTPKAHSDPYLLEVYEKGKDGSDPFYYSQSGSVFENEFWTEEERLRVLRNPRYVRGWEDCPFGGDCDAPVCREGKHPLLTPIGQQVILGAFVIAGGYFFNRFHVARMFTEHVEPTWHGEDHFFVSPQPGRLYQGAFDLGGNKPRKRRKRGSDPTVGMVIDYTERPWQVVYYNRIEGGDADWEQKYQVMADVFETYHMPYLLIDATGQIDSVQEALQTRGVEVEGVQFGGNSSKKFNMLRSLQLCIEMEWSGVRGLLRCPPIEKLKHELDHYVLPDDDIQQDCVMTLAMAVSHVMQWEAPPALAGEVF